ncbi:MAG TPA: dihydroorotate dehydrogenase-like protein, partial [Candidatus Binatia bacterium]|nr:dihydroorotate dehydrogenase-like protein [Candidatus Binatia bacterium]
MNLSTIYLGFSLPHPLMPGASPLVDDLDMVRRLEDAGAAAIVMHSLFEEQITAEERAAIGVDAHGESFAEATSYLPGAPPFALGPDRYLEQLRRIREAVAVPVIASLNGVTASGWLE